MTRAEFVTQLEGTKLPVYYQFAPIGTKVPFIVYTWDYDNFAADDKAYARIANVTVTHYHSEYSKGEDLKTILNENDLFWNCDTDYDPNERVYTDIYTMEVLEDG